MAKTNTATNITPKAGGGARKPKAKTPPTVPETASSDVATRKPPKGKLGIVLALLSRPEGATIEAIAAATGWQTHSVRGAMSGALKKKHGLAIDSEPTEGVRIYRIASGAAA